MGYRNGDSNYSNAIHTSSKIRQQAGTIPEDIRPRSVSRQTGQRRPATLFSIGFPAAHNGADWKTITMWKPTLLCLWQGAKRVLCRNVWSKELLGPLQSDSHAYLAARGALKALKSLLDVVLLAGHGQLSMRHSSKIHTLSQHKKKSS